MYQKILFRTFLVCFLFFFLKVNAQNTSKLEKVYNEAGNNKLELEKVINYFSKNKEDSLKLKATYFLIENMLHHSYAKTKLIDTAQNTIDFNVLDYRNYTQMVSAWDSIENKIGSLDFKRDTLIYDSQIIKADFLIKNIESSFVAWNKPWAKDLDFDTFCEYILPYRGSNEPLEDWRTYFLNEFSWLEDSLQDITDPIEVVNIINTSLKSWFTFDARMYRHPTDLGLKEMLETKVGRCEDMTNLAIYAMRANGIPVMSDYVTHWPNTGNNHAWNSTYNKQGEVVIFMGSEANVGDYKLNNKKAKVYRKTYSIQDNSLSKSKEEYEKVPAWLRSSHSKDVSDEYLPKQDLNIQLINEKPDSVNYVYLCVFNSGKWSATAWAKIENNTANFKNLGTDLMYMVAYYKNDSLIPANYPFIFNQKGAKEFMVPNKNNLIDYTLYATTKKITVKATDEIRVANFKVNKKYELYYWDNQWKLISSKKAKKDKPLKFKKLPKNALFWLKQKDGREDERIFTIEGMDKVLW